MTNHTAVPGPYDSGARARHHDPIPGDAPPREVARAFSLALWQILLALVGLVVALADGEELADTYYDADLADSYATARTLAVVLPVVSFLVGNAIWAWLALRMRDGRGWARTTMAVLCVLSVFGAFFSLVSLDPVSIALNLLGAGLCIATVQALWAPGTDEWFARTRS